MKRKTKLLALLLVVSLSLFALASCKRAKQSENLPEGAFITLVVSGEVCAEYKVPLDKIKVTEGLISVLSYLEEIDALDYEYGESGMLESVGELENSLERGEWIFIYTDVAEDIDVSEYAQTIEYEGRTLTSAGVGASQLKIKDGATYYIGLIVYE